MSGQKCGSHFREGSKCVSSYQVCCLKANFLPEQFRGLSPQIKKIFNVTRGTCRYCNKIFASIKKLLTFHTAFDLCSINVEHSKSIVFSNVFLNKFWKSNIKKQNIKLFKFFFYIWLCHSRCYISRSIYYFFFSV